MDFLTIQTTLESELNSYWPTAGNTPILWENTQQNESDLSNIYIVPQVDFTTSDQIEFGQCANTNIVGIYSIRVVGQVDQGVGAVLEKADLLNNHFSGSKFGTIHTEAGRIEKIGIVDNRFQVSVIIPINSYQKIRS